VGTSFAAKQASAVMGVLCYYFSSSGVNGG
jgi:hypothetical protein